MLHPKFIAALSACVLTLACGANDLVMVDTTPDDPVMSLEAAQLAVVAGDDQEAEVGSLLSQPVIVEVTDSTGAPFPGAPVKWTFQHGSGVAGGSLAAAVVQVETDESGRASVQWLLGTTAGNQTATVEIVVSSTAAESSPTLAPVRKRPIHARGRAGSPAEVTLSPGSISLVQGDSAKLAAAVEDRYGNPVTSVSVAWSSSSSSVAQADQQGMVRASGPGSATIIAQAGGVEGTSTVTVTPPPNQAPTASITTPNQNVSVTVGAAVNFQGTASDADGTIASHAWSFGDGRTASVEDPGNRAYSTAGVYNVTYRVTDEDGAQSAVATRTVTVTDASNQAPTASITTPNQNVSVAVGTAINFQGTASDADGTIASHAWDFGDGRTASVEDPGNRTFATAGVYSVTYRVTDDDGAQSAVATRTVTVTAPNQAPTASITQPNQNVSVTVGTAVDFQGTAGDADGTIASHAWDFGDGRTASVEDPGNRTYSTAGVYNVTYRVTDDDGAQSAVATRAITVTAAPNQTPTASITQPNQNVSVTVGTAVNFQGTASDADGTIASHAWDFGDGRTASVEDPGNRSYAVAGVYNVTYRVTDDDGAQSAVATRTITVTAAPNQAPTASITSPNQNVTVTIGSSVNFQGTASDADGTIASHAWDFGDGRTATVEDPGNRVYAALGTYNVTYRVTDDDGAQSTVASRTVIVVDLSPPPPPGSPDFVSNFSGSTWSDNGKWVAVGGANHDEYLKIFTTSLDASVPGGRGMRTIGTYGHDFWNVIRVAPGSQPRTPNVGETITWRWYYKLISGDGDGDYHPIDWGTNLLNSSPNFAVLKFVWFGGAWQPQIHILGAPRPWYATVNSVLAPNTWYRFEIGWTRTGSSSWTVSYRIYGPTGALLVDGDDMFGNFGSEPGNRLSSATFTNSNVARSAMLEIGSPGVGGMVGSTHEAERYAAIAAFVGAPVVNVPFDASRGW